MNVYFNLSNILEESEKNNINIPKNRKNDFGFIYNIENNLNSNINSFCVYLNENYYTTTFQDYCLHTLLKDREYMIENTIQYTDDYTIYIMSNNQNKESEKYVYIVDNNNKTKKVVFMTIIVNGNDINLLDFIQENMYIEKQENLT